ncbi:MAG: superoxide dismutase [Candidatus Buchananbacteria bacterium]|nr:superoxide dismutase [Candidatus Buchananbacteria bacterium]
MKYTPEELPYSYDALEPFIDQKTMEIHHGKHYVGYVDKLNTALEKYEDLQNKPLEDLLKNLSDIPEEIRTAVRNSGGGALNHAMFWQVLKKDVPCAGEIAQGINDKFGSFEEFKKQFTDASLKLFGSGWSWLVKSGGDLEIITTPNQDTPISSGQSPILCLDIWEHAYYLKYQNRRPEYIEAFFKVINWEQVNEYYKNIK